MFQTLSPAHYLEGQTRHFGHEYIIKLSKNVIESWKTNEWSQFFLKRSCPLSAESNAEFKSMVNLTLILSRHKTLHKHNKEIFQTLD